MKRLIFPIGVACALLFSAVAAVAQPGKPEKFEEIKGQLVRDIKSLRDHKGDPNVKNVIVRDMNGVIWGTRTKPKKPDYNPDQSMQGSDAAVQQAYKPVLEQEIPKNLSITGIGATGVLPADPSMCVGPNHIIQAVNHSSGTYYQIWSKSTGASLKGPVNLDLLTGFGGLGDPVVMYDHLADRYIMTEFANSAETTDEGLIFAVSKTGDPLGGWWIYFFRTGTVFPDYPKYSVWSDAYYATSNDFGASYIGSSIYAFDKSAMLNGAASASLRTFRFNTTSYSRYFTMCPVLLQGDAVPPAGTGGLFAYMNDNFVSGSADSIGIIELDVDWNVAGSATYGIIASLPVSAFNGGVWCTASRGACIPQPNTTGRLEALERRVMNQPIYRNFGTYQGIVLTHFANVNSVAAPRWYELRKTTGNWSIYQQSTYAPADNVHRWLPSIAYNASGDIALAYNVSASTSVYPGIRYVARKATDALNTMTFPEQVIKAGTTSSGSYSRYGDYNHLVADPNGTDLWFTAMFNASYPWGTWVANFNLTNPPVPPTPVCTDNYEANNTTATAKTLSANTTINAGITTSGDIDWFKITTNNTQTHVRVTFDGLPADNYAISLWNSTGTTQLASGVKTGTNTEVLVLNTTNKRITYLIKVEGLSGAFNASTCYSLLPQTSATNFAAPVAVAPAPAVMAPIAAEKMSEFTLKLYPNPVVDELKLDYQSTIAGEVNVTLVDLMGRQVSKQTFMANPGLNTYKISTQKLLKGIYVVQLQQEGKQVTERIEIVR